jgi:hypothetical protein
VFVLLTAFYMALWAQGTADLTEQVAELRALVDQRQARVAELEAHLKAIALAEKTALPPPVHTSPSAPPPVPVSGLTARKNQPPDREPPSNLRV